MTEKKKILQSHNVYCDITVTIKQTLKKKKTDKYIKK
jgi:hypothetical protein